MGKRYSFELKREHIFTNHAFEQERKQWERFRELPEWIDANATSQGLSPRAVIVDLEDMRGEGKQCKGLNQLMLDVKALRFQRAEERRSGLPLGAQPSEPIHRLSSLSTLNSMNSSVQPSTSLPTLPSAHLPVQSDAVPSLPLQSVSTDSAPPSIPERLPGDTSYPEPPESTAPPPATKRRARPLDSRRKIKKIKI